ncbi:MAG TPA: hypothetical protein VNO70_17680 [Blastocatellia bacterium]|nr:hypothetical protein [Blastocatellia bacterium]
MARNELERTITATATIPSGQSLSDAVDLGPGVLSGILMPAAWTAAALTFQVSVDGVTFYNLTKDAASDVQIQAQAGRAYPVEAAAAFADTLYEGNPFTGFRYVKVRSGTSGAPVNQGAERQITLIAKY